MDQDSQPQVLEGTWEEISRRGDELAGRRVRVEVLENAAPGAGSTVAASDEEAAAYQARLQAFFKQLKEVEPDPPTTPPTEFEQILIDKFRKQGLNVR